MMRRSWCLLIALSMSPAMTFGEACDALNLDHIANASITKAALVAASEYDDPISRMYGFNHSISLPAHCQVTGIIAPSIKFEAWFPASGWNGKLQVVGTGGFGGTINTRSMATALRDGYATAANDAGHDQSNHDWMKSARLIRLWGHESTHRMIGPVKELVRAYYKRSAAQSYFAGCSTGGAQAMEEAEYYPADFDGIVANSPGMGYARLMLSFLWSRQAAAAHLDGGLSPEDLQLLHHAAIAQCDRIDGVEDGVLEDPRQCHFDPEALRCTSTSQSHCLADNQILTVKAIMQGPKNPRTGESVYPGFYWGSEASPEYTSEIGRKIIGWGYIQGDLATLFAVPLLSQMVFHDPMWTGTYFDFDKDTARVDAALDGIITAINPDLTAFAHHGGKLIMTQGWADPLNPPTYPIEYFEKVKAVVERGNASPRADTFFRLFMAPGMGHCGSGPGPNEFDAVAALDRWVVGRSAPEQIVAAKRRADDPQQPIFRTRPLCPYPQTAHWKGVGSTDEAANFSCK